MNQRVGVLTWAQLTAVFDGSVLVSLRIDWLPAPPNHLLTCIRSPLLPFLLQPPGCPGRVLQAHAAAACPVRALPTEQCHAPVAVRQQGHRSSECHHMPQEAVQPPEAHL